ncbi:MAG: hypothetical protein AAGA62_14435, partial [Bacteroidota bacterium]
DEATLNGGFDAYTGTGTTLLTWTVVSGSGTFSGGPFNVSNVSTVSGANFNTTSNGESSAPVTFQPDPGVLVVQLQLAAVDTDAGCDPETDIVELYFDPFQEVEVDVSVDGSVELDNVGSATNDNTVSFCAGTSSGIQIVNTLDNAQEDGLAPMIRYTVTPNGLTGLPTSGTSSAAAFNTTFGTLNIVNPSGGVLTGTVDIQVYYPRTNECEGDPVTVAFEVLPQAQATSGIESPPGNTVCDGTDGQVRVTGSPNSVVTYDVLYSGGVGDLIDQTLNLGAVGSNGAPGGSAADFIDVSTTGHGGETITVTLKNVEYATAPACPRVLNESEVITVVAVPEGELTLDPSEDEEICNRGTSCMGTETVDLTFTAPDGSYDISIDRATFAADGFTPTGPTSTIMLSSVVVSGGSATLSMVLPCGDEDGQYVVYTLASFTELGSGQNCPGTVSSSSSVVTITEEAVPFVT